MQKQKTNPNNKKSKTKLQSKKIIPKNISSKFVLSECSELYLTALTDPFKGVANVCVPDNNDVPSAKYRTVARGGFICGTGGFGFVAISGNAVANDVNLAVATTSAYLPTIITVPNPNVQLMKDIRAPYTSGNMTNTQVQARLVARGVRARYTGPEMYASGQMACLRIPTGQTVEGSDMMNLLSRPETRTYPCDRKWHGIAYHPTREEDVLYRDTPGGIDYLTGIGANMVIAVAGATVLIASSYEFEVVSYYEYIPGDYGNPGISAIPNISNSHSDMPGFSQIRNFFGRINSDSTPGPSMFARALNWITSVSVDDVSRVVTGARNVARIANTVGPLLLT